MLSSETVAIPVPETSTRAQQLLVLTKHPLAILLLLAVLATLSYANSFTASFHFDDEPNIVNNQQIKHLTTIDWASSRAVGYLSFALNYALGGVTVWGYHLVNLLIHLSNGWLVYRLVLLLGRTPGLQPDPTAPAKTPGVALLTALLFVGHPIQTQAVTYIVQRFTSLATLWYLLAVVGYLQWRLAPAARGRWRWYAVAVGATLLAMKTKEISFTLPVMLLLVEGVGFRPSPGRRGHRWLPLLPFLALLPLIPLAHSGAVGEAEAGWARETTDISRLSYLVTQSRVIVTYLRLLVVPIQQNLDYDYPLAHALVEPAVLLSGGGLLGVLGMALYLVGARPRWRLVGFGVLWFFLTLAVESSVIPIRDVLVEHRLYLPSVGWLLAVSSGGATLLAPRPRLALLGSSLLVVLFAGATVQRNRVWHDERSLWTTVVARSPQKARAHSNLGVAYARQGQFEAAAQEYRTALRLDPNFTKAYNNLGNGYVDQGRLEDAVQAYQTALRLQPTFPEAHYGLGNTYLKQGQPEAAIQEYLTAIHLQPIFPEAYYNLGNVYAKHGRQDEAIRAYLMVLQLQPDFLKVHNNLGMVYASQGQQAAAIQEYLAELRLNPSFPEVHNNLGNAYAAQGRLDAALTEYRGALELQPNFPEAHYNLGNTYLEQGRPEAAIAEYLAALNLKPDYPEAHNNRGSIYLNQGRLEAAIQDYRTAIELKPNFPEAHTNLGNAYLLKGLKREASEQFALARAHRDAP